MRWGLVITRPAERQLRRMPAADREHMNMAFEEMARDPFAGDVKYLRNREGKLRRRVGVWRILYTLQDERKLIIIAGVKRRGSHTY